MDRLSIGMNVLIKRSDGRVHDALISAMNNESTSVTVEWFEKGETKGKEIDLDTLFHLNPRMAGAEDNAPQKQTPVIEARDARKTVVPSHGRKPLNAKHPPQTSVHRNTGTTRVEQRNVRVPASQARSQPMITNGFDEEEEDEPENLPAHDVTIAPAAKRKSHTLHEIDKLKKNREERRAKQAEVKQQKEQLKNLEPGNPNWEFLGMIRDYRENLEYHPLRVSDAISDHQITVCVRKRPMSKKEQNKKEVDVVTVPNRDHTVVHQPQTKVDLTKFLENQTFRFDYAFDESVTNDMVYRFTAQPLVKTVFEQGFATCFAYGQTGSGKTHTMGGDFHGKTQDCAKGIYALTARDVFRLLNARDHKKELFVACSFFEIYSGKVFDLLGNKTKLRILEDGKREVQIVGLQEVSVSSEQEVLDLIRKGSDVRTAGQTSANNHSSRSHAIFQIILRKKSSRKLHGKFSLIDLAGNERGADTMAWGGDRNSRMEAAEINKSLLALKECIRAMGRNNPHLPFRASKLTMVLRDSFLGENARTSMISMISPGMNSCEHTLNTLRYANRVKELGAEAPETAPKGGARRGSDPDFPMSESPNPTDSDLMLLQSRNEQELSHDLYNFQLTMNHVQEAEERVLDEHQRLYDNMRKWVSELGKLQKMTEHVDYDIESYAQSLRTLLNKIPSDVAKLSENVEQLLSQMQEEERAAAKAGGRRK